MSLNYELIFGLLISHLLNYHSLLTLQLLLLYYNNNYNTLLPFLLISTLFNFLNIFTTTSRSFMSPEKVCPTAIGVSAKAYPLALASHEDVVRDATLFRNTLSSFHFALGSKLQVPVIGGKELNLHVLYVEVTRRGGYDKVVNEKKWREVGNVFEFSPTTTSASYALRKHYYMLLYRYELAYFFRLEDPMLTKIGHSSFQAMGVIEGKFDCGYLVTVNVGDEKLSGVLYHPGYPAPAPPSATSSQTWNTGIIPYHTPQLQQQPAGRRRRRAGDPGRPKPNRSGYNFFFAEKHSALKSLYPTREREFTKMIGHAWTNLSEDEKSVYQNYGVKDKERYQKELEEYKLRTKMETIRQSS